ncbi:MAG: hypothetical protein ACP5U1_01890 [Desulfomonilaceae bacterium]
MKADCVSELGEEDLLKLTVIPELMGGFAHELAQPLNAISLACEVLRFRLGRLKLNDSDQKFFEDKIATIKNQVTRTSEVIKGFKRYTSNSVNISADDIESSFGRICNLLRQQFASRGIEFSVETIREQANPTKFDSTLLDLLIAQCLVMARNNVEFLEFRHKEKGYNFRKKIEAFLTLTDCQSGLLLKWDTGMLHTEITSQWTSLDRLRIICFRELVERIGGIVTIENGYISLVLQQEN